MKEQERFKIIDWANNHLDSIDRRFKPKHLCTHVAEFGSFVDAEQFLSDLLGEDYEIVRGEYYIEEIN